VTQPSLNFLSAKTAARLVRLVDRFLEQLADAQWHRAKDLARVLHTDDRTIRRLGDVSGGRVISGQLGYKLTRFATNDEIDHAEAWLRSQASKMLERAVEIRRARNNAGRAA
jgi:hypothetical protein